MLMSTSPRLTALKSAPRSWRRYCRQVDALPGVNVVKVTVLGRKLEQYVVAAPVGAQPTRPPDVQAPLRCPRRTQTARCRIICSSAPMRTVTVASWAADPMQFTSSVAVPLHRAQRRCGCIQPVPGLAVEPPPPRATAAATPAPDARRRLPPQRSARRARPGGGAGAGRRVPRLRATGRVSGDPGLGMATGEVEPLHTLMDVFRQSDAIDTGAASLCGVSRYRRRSCTTPTAPASSSARRWPTWSSTRNAAVRPSDKMAALMVAMPSEPEAVRTCGSRPVRSRERVSGAAHRRFG